MKKRYIIFLLCVGVLFHGCSGGKDDESKYTLKVLTGSRDGFYNEFLMGILDSLPKKPLTTQNATIEIYNTPGSVYNLELLSQGASNFALVQGDVISEMLLKNDFDIQGVAPLFSESIFIFRLLPPGEKSRATDIDKLIIQNISVPRHRSGAYMTAKRLFELIGLDISNMDSRGNYEAIRGMIKNIKEGSETTFLFSVQNEAHSMIKDLRDGRFDGWSNENNSPTPLWLTDGKRNKIAEFYESIGLIFNKWSKDIGYPVEFVSLPKRIVAPLKELFGVYTDKEIEIFRSAANISLLSTVAIRAFIITKSNESRENVEFFWDIYLKMRCSGKL
jgi:hypothetical protein